MGLGQTNLMRKMFTFSVIIHILVILIVFSLANITFRIKEKIIKKDVKIIDLVEKTPQPPKIKKVKKKEAPKSTPTPAPTPVKKKVPTSTPSPKPKPKLQKKEAKIKPKATPYKTAQIKSVPKTKPKPRTTPKPVSTPSSPAVSKVSMEVDSFPFDYYKQLVKNRILENYNVPSIAAKKNIKCLFRLTLGRNGEILEYALIKSSGDQLLDQAALRAIQFSSFPPLPVSYRKNYVNFTLTFIPQPN